MNLRDDNRIIMIEKAKQALIKGTNIEDSPEEMKVLDNILFRCWQMGWLDRYAPPRHFNALPKEISESMAAGHGSNVPMQPNIPPMPANTSNALEALVSVNATRSNALGEQTKWNHMMLHLADLQLTYSPDWGANGQGDQKLYDFVTELIDEFSGWDVTDTNVGDTISRQAAIKALDKRFDSIPMEQTTEILSLRRDLRKLPAAEPKRIRGRWIVETDCEGKTRTCICELCGYKTGRFQWENPNFCANCGAKMDGEVTE